MNWQRTRLQLEILLWRYGWLWLVLFATLLVGVGFNVWWLPQQTSVLAAQASRLGQLQQAQKQVSKAPAPDAGVSEEARTAQQLLDITFAQSEVGAVLKRIQHIAKTKGVALTQSEIQTNNVGYGGLAQVQVTLPVRCNYPQLRDLIEAMLRQLPGISLDRALIKRDSVTQPLIDAQLKISIWVREQKAGMSNQGIER